MFKNLSVYLSLLLVSSLYAWGDEKLEIRLPGNVTLTMIKVNKGVFIMGAKDGENDVEEVQHRVILTKDFYIGETEVTQAQWEAVMKNNPSFFSGKNHPVERVSWHDAVKFCKKLNQMKKAPTGWKFSLPTEAQWEYAARGGRKSRGCKYSGSNTPQSVAVFKKRFASTSEVKSKKPNELGLYDMSGNAEEWCLDRYDEKLASLIASGAIPKIYRDDVQDPVCKKGSDYVCRGGSYDSDGAEACRVACRASQDENFAGNSSGFRLVLIPIK